MQLTPAQSVFLRGRAHSLEAQVHLGKQGVSDGFLKRLEEALARNELVKIRIGRKLEVDLKEVAVKVRAVLVQQVGHTATLYRPSRPPRIVLPR